MKFEEQSCVVGFYLDGDESKVVKLHCELKESNAFGYGNRSCLIVTEESEEFAHIPKRNRTHVYDTRYEFGIISNFRDWCMHLATNSYRTGGIEPWFIEE